MNANQSLPNHALLSKEQMEALEHIARENHTDPGFLVSLAIEALIAEAARQGGWLPIPDKPSPIA